MSVVALVLAAGQSSRFGADKRRARLADGRSLLAHSVEHAQAVFDDVRVVLREGEQAQDFGLPDDCRIVYSLEAGQGIGHSLAAGVAVLADSGAQSVAILLADMPWIAPTTLEKLADAATPSTIVFPVYEGQRGHPVLFGRDFWPALTQLNGDEGARSVLQAHLQRCVRVAVDDAGVLRDVDTPDSLRDHG
ncbi:nucleotidyltransferase family protein [Pseudomonas sp. UM16]|uniref:nucleotidyltransferase family protein n=1 Tax=Pseudomonas sp. UM16 TaxID=3158962 RepID=UPI00399028C3